MRTRFRDGKPHRFDLAVEAWESNAETYDGDELPTAAIRVLRALEEAVKRDVEHGGNGRHVSLSGYDVAKALLDDGDSENVDAWFEDMCFEAQDELKSAR